MPRSLPSFLRIVGLRAVVASLLLPIVVMLSAAGPVQAEKATGAESPLQSLPYRPSLDLESLDRSADACVDFFRFACGGWQSSHPIPPDQASWSVYGQLADDNQRLLWGIVADAAVDRPDRSPAARLAGDYFAACMAKPEIDRAGIEPLAETLARIDAVKNIRQLAPLVAALQRQGTSSLLFNFTSAPDYVDSSRVIASADAGGLGLTDRDAYLLKDAKSAQLRRDYLAYLSRSFRLGGAATAELAEAQARTVLRIETQLAEASLSPTERLDPRKLNHRMTLSQLLRLAPRFDWVAYFAAQGVAADAPVNVGEPKFFRRIERLLNEHPIADWRLYLRSQTLAAQQPYLAAPWVRAHFDFYDHTLRGVETMPPRWKQCVVWVDRDLGDALGQLFVERTFSPETKAHAVEMTHRIEAAMQQRIEALDWMDAKTRKAALEKLHAVANKIGYPSRWRDYAGLEIRRDDFFGNVVRAQAFEWRRQLAKIGRPVDRNEWGMTPPTVNAYYDQQLNDINFPAGVLQPPLFDLKLDAAPNYGNTGSTIGHELTHAFDDEGRRFDARGNLHDWWTAKDAAMFNRRTGCLVEQFSQYNAVDELKVNGRLTLGENVADLGGSVLAYMAWKAATASEKLEDRDGFTPDQRFFIGMAQWSCENMRPKTQRLLTLTDSHAPAKDRVNGVVTNMPEFARAFSCRPGQPMARLKPCSVW